MEANQAVTSEAAQDAKRARSNTRPGDHRFFGVTAMLAMVITFAGFSRVYFPRVFSDGAALPKVIRVHGAAFACWFVLFVAQIALAARGRIDLHRRLGAAGALLGVVMLMLGIAGSRA